MPALRIPWKFDEKEERSTPVISLLATPRSEVARGRKQMGGISMLIRPSGEDDEKQFYTKLFIFFSIGKKISRLSLDSSNMI